jgi:hypothetical protein
MKRILSIAAVFVLAGCAAVDTQPIGQGKFARAVQPDGALMFQIEANSPERCRVYVERARQSSQYSKKDGSLVCTDVDSSPVLRYRSSFLDEWDGSSFTLSTVTDVLCQYMAVEFLKYKVPGMDRRRFTQTTPCELRT